jgi:hypothetical protein
LTGAVQIFSLHEAHGNYRPPAILEKLSSVHKDQVFALGHHPEPAESVGEPEKPVGAPATAAGPVEEDDKPGLSTLVLKTYFLVVVLCLVLSTTLGLWIGLTQIRQKRLAWILLLAGTLIPVGLLIL